MVTILIDEAGQSGTSEEQPYVVEVKVLQTVEVVMGTDVSIGVGGAVGDSTVELEVVVTLLEEVGAITVDEGDDSGAASLLVDTVEVSATELVSTLGTDNVDSLVEYDSILDANEDASDDGALVEEVSAVAEDVVGVEAGSQSKPTL